jgi:hypothetical protein
VIWRQADGHRTGSRSPGWCRRPWPAAVPALLLPFIAPYFSPDGQADLAVGASAIAAVATELGVPETVTAAEFYRTAP